MVAGGMTIEERYRQFLADRSFYCFWSTGLHAESAPWGPDALERLAILRMQIPPVWQTKAGWLIPQ